MMGSFRSRGSIVTTASGSTASTVSSTGSKCMSIEPIAAVAAAQASPPATPPYIVVSRSVTPIMPPGYTQTQTTKADGVMTTVITNRSGSTVDTIYGTSTMHAPQISVWA
jgi:hypothetical protein